MGDVLGRKQRIKNSDWIDTFGKIEQLVPKEELDQLVGKTVKEIKKKPKGRKPHTHGAEERIPWCLVKSASGQG